MIRGRARGVDVRNISDRAYQGAAERDGCNTHTEIVGLEGDWRDRLIGCDLGRDRKSGETHSYPSSIILFLFIGADPNAGWLEDCVAVDDKDSW